MDRPIRCTVLERDGSQDAVVDLERPDWTVGMERVWRLVVVGPALILLNGPRASGKPTLAGRLVSFRGLAINLDIDVVRGRLGGWLDQPAGAGLAAAGSPRLVDFLEKLVMNTRTGDHQPSPEHLDRKD